jgi:hypothetical protein
MKSFHLLMLVLLAACDRSSLEREGSLNDGLERQGLASTLTDGGTDTTPPDTRLDSVPPQLTRETFATFTFSSTEPGGHFECKRSSADAFSACASPFSYTGLTDGRYTFTVRAVDASGNADPTPSEYSWSVDTRPPVVELNTRLTNGSNATFEFSTNEQASFECKLDSGDFSPCESSGPGRGTQSYSGLADGVHDFFLRATDTVGNLSALVTHRWTVDTSPDTTLGSTPRPVGREPSATFTFSSSTLNASFECKLDKEDFGPCASPMFYSPLADGQHLFAVRAVNESGRVDSSPAVHSWRVDTTAPETRLDLSPPPLTNRDEAHFQFSSPEADVVFQCRRDNGTFSNCSPPVSYRDLSGGDYSFSVRAVDGAGNLDPTPATFAWRVDRTPPQAILNSASTRDTSARFSFSALEPARFECSLDMGAFLSCPDPVEYATLAGGDHSFRVRAIDTAGNVGGETAPYSWKVDLSAPDTFLVLHPEEVTSSNRATFTFGSTKSGSTFRCSLDGADFEACQSPFTSAPLADGEHRFQVTSIDLGDREDPYPALFAWTVDTRAPDTLLTEKPPELSPLSEARFVFSSEPGVTFECSLESAAYAPCESPRLYRGLAEGAHVFTVRAIDRARNTDASPQEHRWRVDTVAPDIQLTSSPPEVTSRTRASFTFSSRASDVRSFECRLDGATGDGSYVPCTQAEPFTRDGLPEGSYTFQVRVTDQAGNTRLSEPYTWRVDTTPPRVRITQAETKSTGTPSATFTFTVSGELGVSFECSLDSDPFEPCFSPKPYTGLSDTFHTFAVRAIDAAGNVGAPATHTWTASTVELNTFLDHASPGAVTRLTLATFVFHANKADATFQCTLDDELISPCTSPFTRSGLLHGAHTFYVHATDPGGRVDNTPASHTWVVDTVAPETAFSLCPAALTHETTLRFAFAPSEPGARFQCSLDGGAFTECSSLSEELTEGFHTLTGRAVDKADNVDPSPATCTFTVDTQAPKTTLVARPPAVIGSPFASFRFSSEPGAGFQCSLDGADFAACTSPASYSELQDGAHVFAVRAVDAAGNVDAPPAEVSFSVAPAPLAPVVEHPASDAVLATGTPTFQGQAQKDTTVSVFVNDTLLGTTRADEAGRWRFQSRAPLPEGLHTMSATATNASARTGPASPSRGFTLDTTPPETAIDSGPPSERTDKAEATFTFSATEPRSTFTCSLNDADFTPCASPLTLESVGAGTHRLRVAARDEAGNVDKSPAEYTWTRRVVLTGQGGGLGCGSTSQSAPTALALLGLLGWALRGACRTSAPERACTPTTGTSS